MLVMKDCSYWLVSCRLRAEVSRGGGESGEYMPLAFRIPTGGGGYAFLGMADVVR